MAPLGCNQWRLWFMLLDATIWILISSQLEGCLDSFCIFWENQIELVVPPLVEPAAFIL
jgi:hypothetical protein